MSPLFYCLIVGGSMFLAAVFYPFKKFDFKGRLAAGWGLGMCGALVAALIVGVKSPIILWGMLLLAAPTVFILIRMYEREEKDKARTPQEP